MRSRAASLRMGATVAMFPPWVGVRTLSVHVLSIAIWRDLFLNFFEIDAYRQKIEGIVMEAVDRAAA